MTRVTRACAAVCAAMVLMAAGTSGAQAGPEDGGAYVTANYGGTARLFLRSELNDALIDAFSSTPLTLESSSVRKQDTTWSAGLGYRLGQQFAVEATYVNVGKVHYHAAGSASSSGTDSATNLELDTRSRGLALAFVWDLPLWNAWGVDARVGAYHGRTSTRYVSTVGEEETTDAMSAISTSLLLGVGASYAATEHLSARLDYAHLSGIKEKAFDKRFAADLVTAGLRFEF